MLRKRMFPKYLRSTTHFRCALRGHHALHIFGFLSLRVKLELNEEESGRALRTFSNSGGGPVALFRVMFSHTSVQSAFILNQRYK